MSKFNFIDKIPDDAVLIDGSDGYYIDKYGNIYKYLYNKPILKSNYLNPNGYLYCSIKMLYDGKMHTYRVHRLVANAFIENPNNMPIVMHKNNNKSDPCVDNLEWGTVSENTANAFKDGLAKNDIGFFDSQSKPCSMYSADTNELLVTYGSISYASKDSGISKSTIARQCKTNKKTRLPVYFRYDNNERLTTIENLPPKLISMIKVVNK